jgi:type IV secretory pathway VirB10-like protein
VHLTTYLLALDEQYDRHASELRKCLRRAEEAEIFSRMLQVQLAKAHASVAAAESLEIAMSKALKEAEDQHAHQLGEAYLVTKRRTLATEQQDPLIVEGIPVHSPKRRRTGVAVPPAPPPLEVSEVEPLIPLTQPLPREEADS